MIALALSFALGATVFVEQPLPGLSVGARQFPAALATSNAIHADLDNDGRTDLLLPSGVWFQKDGHFPASNQLALPRELTSQTLYAEDGHLYSYGHGRIESYSLLAGRWQQDWEAAISFDPANQPTDTAVFHDLDADGRAELILAFRDSLRVFRLAADALLLGEFPIYPPARLDLPSVPNLWPAASRSATGPSATRDFRVLFDGSSLQTREVLRVNDEFIEQRLTRYSITRSTEGQLTATPSEQKTFPSLPRVVTACRLVRDGPVAFAGARDSDARPHLGSNIVEVLIAQKPDTPVQTLRTKSSAPLLALADFDGDGDTDLLGQSNTLEDGPPREVLMSLISARSIRQLFFVHVQDTDGRFEAKPRQNLAVDIDMGGPAIENGPRWQAYRQGLLTCNSADFNGDGRADIAAWVAPDRINIWFNHEGVFEKKPDVALKAPADEGIVPADVDGDGRADLVVLPQRNAQSVPTVFFSR